MKTALCFYGQPRYIKECSKNIHENILDLWWKPDVYYHFWWDPSYIGQIFKFHATDRYTNDMMEEFHKYYPKTQGFHEKQEDFDLSQFNLDDGEMSTYLGANKHLWLREVLFKQMSAWRSIEKSVSQLVDKGYEWVILTRTDVLPQKYIPHPQFYTPLENQIIFDYYDNHSHLADWFICGRAEDIIKYSQLYRNFINITRGEVLISTTLAKKHMEMVGLSYKIFNFDCPIFRGYEQPTKMEDYSEDKLDNRPYWMKT